MYLICSGRHCLRVVAPDVDVEVVVSWIEDVPTDSEAERFEQVVCLLNYFIDLIIIIKHSLLKCLA